MQPSTCPAPATSSSRNRSGTRTTNEARGSGSPWPSRTSRSSPSSRTSRLARSRPLSSTTDRSSMTDRSGSQRGQVLVLFAGGPNPGRDGFIEVIISSVEPSLFARVIGLLNWDVGARAVATNGSGGGAPFSMLALDPTGCQAIQVTGQGQITSWGNIQGNSTCPDSALKRSGQGVINVVVPNGACNVG